MKRQSPASVSPTIMVIFLSLLVLLQATAAVPKPNIVLILADDLGWNALGCQGNKDVSTPNLDRLAAEGMRFTHAYAEPQCSPTRGALFSGQWPARTGMFAVTHEKGPAAAPLKPPAHLMVMPPQTASLALSLRRAGYTTGMSGKWHIGDNYNAAPLIRREGGKYFDRYGFDFVGESKQGNAEPDKNVDAITDDLLGFIERSKDRPFFAYFAHHAPHAPMQAPRAIVEKYAQRGFKRSSSPLCVTSERPTANYYAMVEHLDASVGRVQKRLNALGLATNTVLIFASDNGGLGRMADMKPLRESKGAPYEGGIRVPLIVRWPGNVAPGSTCAEPVHTVDFYPTFMALSGGATPAGHLLDGESLLPLLQGTGRLRRDTLYWHLPTYTPMYGRTPCAVVRRGPWKFIHYFGDFLDTTGMLPEHEELYGKLILGPRTELYNLQDDASEQHDLAGGEPERVRALREALESFWRETGAALPTRNPEFDPAKADWWKPAQPARKKR